MAEQFDEVVLPAPQAQFEEIIPASEASDKRQKATQFLQEVSDGQHPNITEEELLPIVKVASQDARGNQTTPLQRLGTQVGNVASLVANPTQAAGIGAELAKQAWYGIKGVISEAPINAQTPGKEEATLAAGALGDTASFVGSTGINAKTGIENLISQAANKITGQEIYDPDLNNARSAIGMGRMNAAIKGAARTVGVDPESSTYHTGGLIGQALIPIGGEAKAASTAAKIAEGTTEAIPKVTGAVLEKGAQAAQNKYVQAAALTATGHPIAGLGVLAERGLENKFGALGGWLMNTRRKIMDASLGRIEGLGADLRALPEGSYKEQLLQDAQSVVEKNNARLASIAAKEEITPDAYVFQKHPDGSYVHPEEFLPKPEKEIRKIQLENDNQAEKIAQLNSASDFAKVTGYATKLGLATAGNIGIGMGIGGIIGGINAQPGDDESAKHMAVMMGAFAAPFAPIHASRALRDIRAEAGREAFQEIGKDAISPDHPNYDAHQQAYNGLKPEVQDAVDVASGMLKSMGGKGVVILPKEEFLKMQGGDASKAPGRGFVRGGTIYLNSDSISQGVIGHEISHFLPQALGQSVFDILPDLKAKMEGKNASQAYKDFESYYNSLSPEKGNIPEEVLAETGRRVLTDMPPELFYGGESGEDVLKRWGGKILEKVSPEWYNKNQIDSVLKAPVSKADEAAVRAKLFEIGQRKGQEPPRNAPDEPPATSIPPDPSKAPTEPPVSVEPPISAPSGAVEALIGLGEKKASAQAKVDAATAEILSENGQPTLEEVVRRSVLRTVPVPVAPESSLSQAKAPTEGQSDVAKVPPAPAPIVETPPQSAPIVSGIPTKTAEAPLSSPMDSAPIIPKNIVASPEIKTDTPPVSSENPMLVGPRTDKYGRKSVSGRIFDPSIPEHAALAEKAGLAEANIAKLKELSDKMGETVGIDYSHAPEEGLGRKESQKKTLAQARIEGAKREKLSKTFVPTWIEFTSGTNKAVIRGFSPDKFYENVSKVFENHPEVMEPYSGVNDPKLTQDFQNYAENHANGYTGMGKPIEGTELTPVKPNPDYQPHIIPEDRANVINLLMGDTSAAEGVRKASPVKLEKRALAKANAPFFDPPTGETNKIRATKGDMGLESVSETLRPELIDKIREPYVEDVHTIRPSGAAPETRASLAKAGTPRSDYVASGFMPDRPKVLVAIRLKGGSIVSAPSHSMAYDIINDRGLSLAGSEEGFTVNGKFLYRDEAFKKLGGSTAEDLRKKPETPFGKNDADLLASLLNEDFKGKTIEAGEPPWSIRLKELETREWNGAKLTDPEQKELLDLHKQAKEEYGSYANWFEKMGAEKDYTSGVFGDEKQKPTQFMPSVELTKNDAQEVQHKLGVLKDSPELIEDYGLTEPQVQKLWDSVPANGGTWQIPDWAKDAVSGEMLNHVETLRDMAGDAKSGGEIGQSLAMHRQAKKFEEMFSRDSFMPAPHIEREAERLGLQYKGAMGDKGELLIFNDPITKSTISIKADAEKGALQEKLQATREKFAGDKMQFMPDSHPDAIKEPAFRLDDGRIISNDVGNHSFIEFPRGYNGEAEPGFITNSGVFLDRKEAYARAVERKQIGKLSYDARANNKGYEEFQGQLEGETFKEARRDKSMPNSPQEVPAPKSPPKIKSLRAVKPPEKKKKRLSDAR